ncbi:MAG: hypothetical protein KF732_12735, partial [Flavobacteriales bacterium]|nr:hypothetical protein [Flavobacteriales bacterium]
MRIRLYTTVLLSFFSLTKASAQLASTPCAAGPLPNACAPNTINLTSSFTNSGVTNPSTENGVGCSSVGSNITAGNIYDYDAWYTTVVDANGEVSVYAAIVTGDPVVGIYSGPNCSTLTLRSCDDDSGTGLDALATATGLTPGATVWIRVWDYNGGTGTYTTTATGGTPPANDNCAAAQNLTVNAAPVAGTDYCATVETSDWQDCEGNTESNVWYSFTIPTSGQTTVNITNISCFGSGNGVDVTIMTGNCAAFSSVICQQAISSNSAINFTGVGGTTYYVMVDGDNAGGANSLCNFNIDVDLASPVCGTVDFHAEENVSPFNIISPFPSTMSCTDDWIYLAADDTVISGNYISPAYNFIVTGNIDGNDEIWIYSGGTATLGSGTAIFANTIPNSTTYTVYGGWLSATTPYYLELCNTSGNIPWQVENAGNGTIHGTGTSNSGNGNCQRFGPFYPDGIATWTSNAPAGSISLTTTNGLTYFDPAVAGPGSYQVTYNWDDENGCTGSSTKTITVTAPYSFTSLDYATVCINSGNVSPTLVADAGGVYSSATLGASLNTSTGVVNSNTAPVGTHTITYTLGTMPCGVEGIATITINPTMTASAPSSNPIVCINTAITNITHTTTSATGIGAATGLPAGVTAGFAGNTITISGTPSASGTFNYSIPLTGGCGTVNATGTITVNPNNTVTPASSSPTICINNAITNITHTTTGATGIGAASGLPAGVSANWSGNTITISGTPSTSGTFNYSIPLTGGCGTVNATGTITVTPNNTVTPASSSPTVCINTAITNITHTTTGATGIGAATGLPAGVSVGFAGNTITISGTPTASGTFNYSIPLTGGCGTVNATGTITVTPLDNASFAYSGNTYCLTGTNPTPISINTPGGVFSISGVGVINSSTGQINLAASGLGTFTITYNTAILGNPCPNIYTTDITITAAPSATFSYNSAAFCQNAAAPILSFGAGASAGVFSSSPGGLSLNTSNGAITLSTSTPGVYTVYNTIAASGGCAQAIDSTSITINPNATINLTSAGSTTNQTLCINTPITNITYAIGGGGTGAGVTGLPAGVNGSFGAGVFTISGTPSASGTFNYTVTTTGTCGQVSSVGTISVTPDNTVTPASSSPTLCINTSMTNITHTTTGATGIGVASGLPTGVNANWSGNTITISGTPTASGTFNYSIPLTGGCGTINATGTIIVTPDNTVTPASSSPTVCINTAITNITHTTTGATGIGAPSGLPAGVTAGFAGNTITISGTPTASGTFNYSIPLTGGCGTVNATGTIIVTPDNTVTPASSSPTVCINNAITNITHTTTGATGIGAPSGLPAGVTAGFAGNTITISGTPTVSGTFNYSIPLTGGCGTINATGVITVNPDNTVTPASSSPTVCINTAITNITHTTTDATGIGAATGLPAGVSASWFGNTITISGIPTASGTFNYSIPLTGGCGTVSATGTITVNPDMTVTPASSSPTVCINTAITNITHTTTGATGIGAAIGLPAGVSANWAGNTITISGTPTASGTFNYTIPLTGGCGIVNATGTITVNPDMTVTPASSSPTVCINTAITNITHTTTGATGIGAAIGLPAGVTAGFAGNTITISGTPTASGTFNYTIPLTGGCGTVNATGTITVTPNNTVTPASSSPTVCINIAMTNITHTTTGATGIGAATGLPAGVTAGFAGNTITISGTPTASGTFNYTIPLTGGCGTVNATGTITVNPDPTIGITTASECENITGSGEALNIDVTALETAINATANITWYTDNTYTTSYNPTNETVSNGEVFYYEVELNGCVVQGTITYSVSGNIVLNDPTPEFCEDVLGGGSVANVDLTTFNNSVFAGATSYTWATGPTGVTINDGDSINVQVQQGSCPTVDIFVHFTVNPLPTATISGGGTICAGEAIPDVTIALTGTGPWSVTYTDGTTPVTINPLTSPATISGLADGTYTVTAVSDNNCTGTFSGSATILTNPLPTATISGGGTICAGEAIPDVTIALTGTGPWSVTYTDGTTPVTINPLTSPATISGLADGTYTVTAVSDNNCTGTFSGSATVLTNPLPTAI